MPKKYILLHFSRHKEYIKFSRVKFINVSLLPPPYWKIRFRKFDEPELFQDKEIFNKYKTHEITKIEYEMTYRYKLNQLKNSGWLDKYIEQLNNSEEYDTIAFMYHNNDFATLNTEVLCNYLHDNYGIEFDRVGPLIHK